MNGRAEDIPSYRYNDDRNYFVKTVRSASRLDGTYPFRVYLYDGALKKCDSKKTIKTWFDSAFFSKTMEDALSEIHIDYTKILSQKKIIVALDAFPEKHSFSSFYINDSSLKIRMVSFDCQINSLKEWRALLIHELVHALLEDFLLPSWFEEGVAQILENDVGGKRPQQSVEKLHMSSKIPHLLEKSRPLQSSESYGLSFLFVNFIFHHWKGWELFPSILEIAQNGVKTNCPENDFLSMITCDLKNSLEIESIDLFTREKFTQNGIIRFFAAAFAAQSSKKSLLKIPYWKRMKKIPDFISTQEKLLPGDFRVFSGRIRPKLLDTRLEFYQIFTRDKKIQILKGSKPINLKPTLYLIINTTSKEIRI